VRGKIPVTDRRANHAGDSDLERFRVRRRRGNPPFRRATGLFGCNRFVNTVFLPLLCAELCP
jgi:hypothetical protein